MADTPATRIQYLKVKAGSTNVSLPVYLELDAGGPLTAADKDSFTVADAGKFEYFREGATAKVDAAFDTTTALGDGTLGTHADGTIKEMDATDMPGVYNLDLPDAIFAAGADWACVFVGPDATIVAQPIILFFDLQAVSVPVPNVQYFTRKKGVTNVAVPVYFESIHGGPKISLAKAGFTVAGGAKLQYIRQGGTAAVDAAADSTYVLGDASAIGTHSDSSVIEIDGSNMKGWYEVNLPDAIFAAAAEQAVDWAIVHIDAIDTQEVVPVQLVFDLTGIYE